MCFFFFSSRRRHTRFDCDWSSDVCSSDLADSWVSCALADRDVAAARAALLAAGENTLVNEHAVHFNHWFVEGIIARLEHDQQKARAAFEAARAEQEKIVQAQPGYAPPLCVLGVIDALLGRKQEAVSECRRAIELLPVEKEKRLR